MRFRSSLARIPTLATLAASSCLAVGCLATGCDGGAPSEDGPVASWPEYGGDKGGLRFSPLTQIDRSNVDDLEIAWVHRSGDVADGSDGGTRTSFNVTPIVVNDTLYYCTGMNRVFALDPESGEPRWSFDPVIRRTRLTGPYPRVCRGVAHWASGGGDACAARIFTATVDAELIALDAATGLPCDDFGEAGRVALREGTGAREPWEYYTTSPPLVLDDVVVVGALVSDNVAADAPAGVVRAFDVRSGALRWAWDPVPPGYEPPAGGPRYALGTPNVWSILSGDAERGLIFVPTGNASPDYFAASRNGLDHYASSVVALDARSGRVAWHFQTVHHDVWDYDVASQPVLFTFREGEREVPAVAQGTKMGHLFLLDRTSGAPLFPVEERPVPQGGVAGESLSPTQPFPTHPEPLHDDRLDANEAFGFTPWDRGRCRDRIASLRNDGLFTPPTVGGSIQFPGSIGGMNWGSVAIDPGSQVLYVNQSHSAAVVTLIPRAAYGELDPDGYGYPVELYPMDGTPYGLSREPLLSPLGAPCNPRPWGTLTAVDLVSGEVRWQSTLGSTRDQAPFPLWFDWGSPNLGGPLVTAGGLVFIGATTDKFLRAYDTESGDEIWRARLPYTANSTPMTYRLRPEGRQYVVTAAGGHGWSEPGDALVAFALDSD